MNNYAGQGHAVMGHDDRVMIPREARDVGAISQAVQRLHTELSELNEQISLLSERLAPVCSGKPVASSIGENEEKQGPASKHAESLRELQAMVRSCRNRINVISSQLDI